jgi:hypothetical protein
MAHLGKVISELLQNAGYDIEESSEELGTVLAIDTDIPDDAATRLKSGLLTLESAKNNPEIKKHFTAQALNTVDTTLNEFADEYGEIPADKLAEINAEKSSYKKTTMMLKALKEVEASKAGKAGDDGETKKQLEARKAKIKELTDQLNSTKTAHEEALKAERERASSSILNYAQNAELGGFEYGNSDLEKETNILIARQLVDKHLKELGALPKTGENGSIKLVQASDPEMEFMLENKSASYRSLAEKILSEKKLLKVSDPAPAGANGGGNNTGNPNGNGGGNGTGQPISQEVSEAYADQIAALTG